MLPRVREATNYITEIVSDYEVLMEQCRKKYGSSVAKQMCKRKKKQNRKKERKRARKCQSRLCSEQQEHGIVMVEEYEIVDVEKRNGILDVGEEIGFWI